MSVSKRYQDDIVQKFEAIHAFLQGFLSKHNTEDMRRAYYERIATHLRTCVVLNFCNADNKKTYQQRKKDFLAARSLPVFAEAMEKADLSQFPFRERVLSGFIKWRWFWGCEILYKVNGLYEKVKG
jgi:hypothetical protein